MDTNLNTAGYDLYEVTPTVWLLHIKNGGVVDGSFKEVITYAVSRLGFDLEEIEIAISEMMKMDHNGAHFGMHGGFIYTFKREFSIEKVG